MCVTVDVLASRVDAELSSAPMDGLWQLVIPVRLFWTSTSSIDVASPALHHQVRTPPPPYTHTNAQTTP